MEQDGELVDVSGQQCSGCKNTDALNYCSTCIFDCIGQFGNTNETCCSWPIDCNGEEGGQAYIDECGVCVGGTTGLNPNEDMDCAGVCFGEASFDLCNVCSGGTTNHDHNSDQDCLGECFGNAELNADGQGNCCDPAYVSSYYFDGDGDGLGAGDAVTYCEGFQPNNFVLNNIDEFPDYYCPQTCDDSGQNQGNGDSVCIVDCRYTDAVGSGLEPPAAACGGDWIIDDCMNCVDPDDVTAVDCANQCLTINGIENVLATAYLDQCGQCVAGETNSTNTNPNCIDLVDNVGYDEALNLYQSGNNDSIFEICPPDWARDCAGTCFGNASVDCFGICGGPAQLDQCGVCYDPGSEDPPNQCVGCTDSESCTYDPDATVDSGNCFYEDCQGGCTCEENNQQHDSCFIQLDECGECGGDGDCEGCTDPSAVNYDEYATQNLNLNCIYGDLTMTPQSTTGMGLDYYVFNPVGNDGIGQNTNIGATSCDLLDPDSILNDEDVSTTCYNSNYGGWKFQNPSEWTYSYRLIVDRKRQVSQTTVDGDEGVNTVDQRVTEQIDGTIIDSGATGAEECTWVEENPAGNQNSLDGMYSFESFINCGYGKKLDTDGLYFIELHATGSLGSTAKLVKEVDVQGLYSIQQSLQYNDYYQLYLPRQGINIPYDSSDGNFLNTRHWYEQNNKDPRPMLGCFWYDEDQNEPWEPLGETWKYLNKNLDLRFTNTRLNGYCYEVDGGYTDENNDIYFGRCISGVNHNGGCGGNSDCEWGLIQNENGIFMTNNQPIPAYFSPDVNATTKRAQYRSYPIGSNPKPKAKAHEYYERDVDPESFEDMLAPSKVNFLFTPRAISVDMEQEYIRRGDQVWGPRNRKPLDDATHEHYVSHIDWGDETTAVDLEYVDVPHKVSFLDLLDHTYEKAGIYEVSGFMFSVYKHEACRSRCSLTAVDETSPPPWFYNGNPSLDVFNISPGQCDEFGGEFIVSEDNICGTVDWKKFTYRINITDDEEDEVFLPFDTGNAIIGGTHDNSIYYKTISRELGYLTFGGQVDLKFEYLNDKLKTEYALAQMDEFKIGSTMDIFNNTYYSGSVNSAGELQNAGSTDHPSDAPAEDPVVVASGSYDTGYGEMGDYFGNADIAQFRLIGSGKIGMDKMLGFVNFLPDMSYKLMEGTGAVMVSAPHSPRTLRPTALPYDPEGLYPAWDHAPDWYTGAIAYELAQITGCHAIIATYMNDDANYYHYIGHDYFGRSGETATPAFEGMEGELHPYKKALKEYLIAHPEIKLVIDIHGAGEYRVFALDIGVGYPVKNRDPNGDYVTGWTDSWGWYPGNDLGITLSETFDPNDCATEFEGAASPELPRFWNSHLSSEWDLFSDMDKYAPSLHTDLGKGIISPTNSEGHSLLHKMVDIFEANDIGAGKAYADRYTYGLWDCDGDGNEEKSYRYYRGEYLDQQPHYCPDGQDNPFNLAGYLDECDTSIYTGGCREAWGLYLDGSYYCEEPGIKKPIVFGRDFTGGAQNTITRYVSMDATMSDSYFDSGEGGGSAEPAPFVGKVDAIQIEYSRNHRTFELNQPRDVRNLKATTEIINWVNNFYGFDSVTPNWETDSHKYYEEAQQAYDNWLLPLGEILLDEKVAASFHPGNPGSKRHWSKIIPQDYKLSYRDGFYDYSVTLNKQLYVGGENEITITPQETMLYNDDTFTICKEDEPIGGISLSNEEDCSILYSDISFDKYINKLNFEILRGDEASSDYVLSNNIIFWNIESTDIGSETFNDIFDGYNNVEEISWVRHGMEVLKSTYSGTWSGNLSRLENGRFYRFKVFDTIDLQRDNLLPEYKLPQIILEHNKKIDINSNQQWLKTETHHIHEFDDMGCEYVNQAGCVEERGEVLLTESYIPYYPVLPRFNLFGDFSSDGNVQKSPVTLLPGQVWSSEGEPIGSEPGDCVCNNGVIVEINCNLGYEAECYELTPGDFQCSCNILPQDDNSEENPHSNYDDASLYFDSLIENNQPFGTPERIWNEYDKDSPAVSDDYFNNLNNIYTLTNIDINFTEIDDDNTLENNSGTEVIYKVFGDYKVTFDKKTRSPSKSSFENLPQIRDDEGNAY